MPRFTSWPPAASLDPQEGDRLIDDVLRPSLRQAFPLPAKLSGGDARFQDLLGALAQRAGGGSSGRSLHTGS